MLGFAENLGKYRMFWMSLGRVILIFSFPSFFLIFSLFFATMSSLYHHSEPFFFFSCFAVITLRSLLLTPLLPVFKNLYIYEANTQTTLIVPSFCFPPFSSRSSFYPSYQFLFLPSPLSFFFTLSSFLSSILVPFFLLSLANTSLLWTRSWIYSSRSFSPSLFLPNFIFHHLCSTFLFLLTMSMVNFILCTKLLHTAANVIVWGLKP